MTLSARDLAITAASFGLAWTAFGPRADQNPPAIQPVKQLTKLANAVKLARATRQLRLQVPPRGIRSLVELNANKPCNKGLAALSFSNVGIYSTAKEGNDVGSVGGASLSSSYAYGLQTNVYFMVVQPGKAHVLTFYVKGSNKEYKIGNQTFTFPAGDQTIVYATIPAEAGWKYASLTCQGSNYTFYNVEIDVLD